MAHTCALLADATVRCWGYNYAVGELGDGTTNQSLSPVAVSGLSGASALAAGIYHTCALLADTTVRCWGYNHYGGLGDGTTMERLSPVAVTGLSGVSALATGAWHTCALLADATVRCWGDNFVGQLGDGTTTQRLSPVAVTDLGALAGGSHAICVRATDSVGNTSDGTACATLTVSSATLTSIAVTPASPTIPNGTDQQFTATGTYSDATTADLTASVSWASSSPAVATISATGLAHGVSLGTSTISATLGLVSGTTLLTVTKPVPVLTYTGSTAASPGASVTLSATLTTTAAMAIARKTVTFTLNGSTMSATTNKSGVASIKTKAPTTTGSYPIGVAFAGDTTYAAASTSATLTVLIATKLTHTRATKAAQGATITLSATLKTATRAAAISGRTVTFTLNGVTVSATTKQRRLRLVGDDCPGERREVPDRDRLRRRLDIRRGLDLGHPQGPLTSPQLRECVDPGLPSLDSEPGEERLIPRSADAVGEQGRALARETGRDRGRPRGRSVVLPGGRRPPVGGRR